MKLISRLCKMVIHKKTRIQIEFEVKLFYFLFAITLFNKSLIIKQCTLQAGYLCILMNRQTVI